MDDTYNTGNSCIGVGSTGTFRVNVGPANYLGGLETEIAGNGFLVRWAGQKFVFANAASYAKWMEDWALERMKELKPKKCVCV
jgi:hypothetical protein